ncbi:MAG: response regulator receiver protein [Segetibacter sp.]|nr:response regulator receiver protein [Segetibacter sp.]
MAKNGPIIILEEDEEEQELMRESMKELDFANELKFFSDGEVFIDYLKTTADSPFVIISSIYLTGIDGLEVRKKIQENDFLRRKAIPYIFLTIKDDMGAITAAYDLTVQGYFLKRYSQAEHTKQLKLIMEYWLHCRHVNA